MATLTQRIFSEGWDILQVVLVPYLVVSADNWGLIRRNDALFAAALTHPKTPVSLEDVADRISELIAEGVLLPYEVGGQQYLAIRKIQDYETRKYFAKKGPSCPIPPVQVFRKLSANTQATFRHCASKFPETSPIAVAVADAVGVAVDSVGKPTAGNPKQLAIDHYYQRLQKHSGLERPPFPGGQAAKFFAARLKAGDTVEGLIATVDHFFDRWISEHGAGNFGHYQQKYTALAKAVMEGATRG